jgi:hypothetical protein
MSSPIFNLGTPRGGPQFGFSLLETLIDARANAQQQFLSEVRRRVNGMPLLDAGLQFAEILAKQQRDFGHTVIRQMERAVSSRGFPNPRSDEPYAPEPVAEDEPHPNDSRADTARHAPVLRVTIPWGTHAVAVPLQLRNHRSTVDTVSLSAIEPTQSGIAVIPTELIRFDPEMLAVAPQAEASAQMFLRLTPSLVPGREYWSEIVIAGAETKRIPLVLQVRPEPQPDNAF